MIGVLLTSTCWYEGITKEVYSDRVHELADCIRSVKARVRGPYEMIIADNSPPDRVPTEQILSLCPPDALFLRSVRNPGKTAGEAALVRDGLHLSAARGHRYTLKLTGRYFLEGEWAVDDGVASLEKSGKKVLAKLLGRPLRELSLAVGHPLYAENADNGRFLMAVATQAFLADPAYLVRRGVFGKPYLYRDHRWVNYEQAFWHAVGPEDILPWRHLPIGGFAGNRGMGIPIQLLLKGAESPALAQYVAAASIPAIDVGPLLETGGQ